LVRQSEQAAADVLRRWFPSVLQAVRPYFSPDDVAKGARWSAEIAKELEGSRVGLLVITPENQEAPWLLFEAGALAKNLDRSKVCPILFGAMEPTDVKGPLVQFQAAAFSQTEMKRVIKMMNAELGEAALPVDVLDNVFDMWWPSLKEQVDKVLVGRDESDDEARRPDRELLEEVLALTRRLASDRERRPDFEHPVWDDLFRSVLEIARVARAKSSDEETTKMIRRLTGPLEYLSTREMRRGPVRSMMSARRVLAELESILLPESKKVPEAASEEAAS